MYPKKELVDSFNINSNDLELDASFIDSKFFLDLREYYNTTYAELVSKLFLGVIRRETLCRYISGETSIPLKTRIFMIYCLKERLPNVVFRKLRKSV